MVGFMDGCNQSYGLFQARFGDCMGTDFLAEFKTILQLVYD